MSKSFVSALIGIAVGEGAIASVEDPVTRYALDLAGRLDCDRQRNCPVVGLAGREFPIP